MSDLFVYATDRVGNVCPMIFRDFDKVFIGGKPEILAQYELRSDDYKLGIETLTRIYPYRDPSAR